MRVLKTGNLCCVEACMSLHCGDHGSGGPLPVGLPPMPTGTAVYSKHVLMKGMQQSDPQSFGERQFILLRWWFESCELRSLATPRGHKRRGSGVHVQPAVEVGGGHRELICCWPALRRVTQGRARRAGGVSNKVLSSVSWAGRIRSSGGLGT